MRLNRCELGGPAGAGMEARNARWYSCKLPPPLATPTHRRGPDTRLRSVRPSGPSVGSTRQRRRDSRARLRAHARRCRATRVGCLPPTYCYPVCNARVPHLDACRSCFTCCCLVFLSLHVRHRLLLRVWTKKCTRRGYEEK